MQLKELVSRLGLRLLAGTEEQLEREAQGCYIGDLLSWAMGKVRPGDVWITVMGNVNAVAVAVLAGASCLLLCDDAPLDAEAESRAREHGVAVLQSGRSSFELAAELSRLL